MNKAIVVLITLILSLGVVNAQKIVKKSVLNAKASNILIDASNCFELKLETTESNEIVVEAQIDGEYSKDLLLKVINDGPSIKISTGFQPSFKDPNDKLSAHKVISIALKIQIPKNLNVSIKGIYTNVFAIGRYGGLKIALEDGSCELSGVNGKVHVNTQSGTINVSSKGATVVAHNSFGNTTGEILRKGNDYFNLTTITGNIYLKKTD